MVKHVTQEESVQVYKVAAEPDPFAHQTGSAAFRREVALATAPAWRPSKGDILTGIPVGARVGGQDSEYGEYPILIFETPDGGFSALHAFHTLVRDRLTELKPEIKQAVKDRTPMTMVYLGEVTTNATKDKAEKDQTSYHHYYIRMGSPEAAVTTNVDEFDF